MRSLHNTLAANHSRFLYLLPGREQKARRSLVIRGAAAGRPNASFSNSRDLRAPFGLRAERAHGVVRSGYHTTRRVNCFFRAACVRQAAQPRRATHAVCGASRNAPIHSRSRGDKKSTLTSCPASVHGDNNNVQGTLCSLAICSERKNRARARALH